MHFLFNVWEFLNEPVWTGFCLPQSDFNKPGANYTPGDYVNLLKQAYPVIKAADPEGRVIGGFAAQPWHYASEFVALGGLQFTDIYNMARERNETKAEQVFSSRANRLDRILKPKN